MAQKRATGMCLGQPGSAGVADADKLGWHGDLWSLGSCSDSEEERRGD